MCCDGRSVSVYLSLLLSCSVQEPEEKRKCVTKICSSIDFPFEAWNTSQDLKPNNNPRFGRGDGFSALWKLCAGLQVTLDSQHTLSSECFEAYRLKF